MSTTPPGRDPFSTTPGGASSLAGLAGLASLAGLPFGEQRRRIDEAVDADERLPELLETLAGMPDHEPFAHAVRQMGRRGRLSAKPVSAALGRILRRLPDTGVQRLLGGLARAPLPAEEREVLAQTIATAMRHLGLQRLAAYCLMDRWLKNEDAEARLTLGAEAVRVCRSAIARSRGGGLDALPALENEVLLRVPGAQMPILSREAQDAGVGPAWLERRQRFAGAVLEVLEAQPKSLSQANAEEILSRRVYTEPGHFLSELLQNAEDACATRWVATLEDEEVRVWHDGLDFDARDVVGVLSIGQTTKGKGQIGFFGVGFKSVYEICERPQIYSDVFRFEVADVSIPRRLARRPGGAPQTGTLLCLPLRDPGDGASRPGVLFDRARTVPPETLLTLDHLRTLEVTQGNRRYEAHREPGARPGRERILAHEEPDDGQPRGGDYLVIRRRVAFSGGHRESSRAAETPLLVAVRLDPQGRPVPLPEGAATVYSHLPTGERTGLRFLLHAHFDLPIDRERLDLSSPFNLWAIAQAGEALAEAVAILAREAAQGDPRGGEVLVGLLDVLPRPAELTHGAWGGAWESLRRKVQDLALLPAAKGGGLRPGVAAVLLDPRLVDVLDNVELDLAGRRALLPLGPRSTALALELGAATFGRAELLALLRKHLGEHPEGVAPGAPWMGAALPRALESLADSEVDPAELAQLPLLPDAEGRLYLPASIARADPGLRALYGRARPLLSPALEAQASPRLLGLMDALGVPVLSAESLVADLGDPRRREALIAQAGLSPLLELLAGQPDRILSPLPSLALFPDTDGARRPLVHVHGEPLPLWRPPRGPLGAWLRGMRGARPPLIDAAIDAAHGALLDRLGAPRRTLVDLLEAHAQGHLGPLSTDLDALHEAIEHGRAELTPTQGLRLAEAPIFPTRAGGRRPLLGPGRALLTSDLELRELIPRAPWVLPEVSSLGYLAQLPVPSLGAADLVDALTGGTSADLAPWLPPAEPAPLHRLYAYLSRRGPGLDAARTGRLALSPLWLDRHGSPRPLGALRLPPTAPTLATLWDAWPLGTLVELEAEEGMAALACAEALGLRSALRRSDFPGLVEELRALAPETLATLTGPHAPVWPLLAEALNAASRDLPRSAVAVLSSLRLFLGSDGVSRPLGDWATPPFDQTSCALAQGPIAEALALGSRPLLEAGEARRLGPLLEALGALPADVRVLVDAVETDAALRTAPACKAVRAAFAAEAQTLGRAFGAPATASQGGGHARLQALPLWPSRSGRLRPSSALVRPRALDRALGPCGLLHDEGRADDLLDEDAAPEANALEGLFRFRSPAVLLLERLGAEARPGAPLGEQPPFLQRTDRFGPLLELLHAALGPQALSTLPLAVDARGCLVAHRLHRATPEEIQLARGLPLLQELADPLWAAQAAAVHPDLAPPLAPRRLILALAETARGEAPTKSHPHLGDPGARARLWAWMLTVREAIARDDQARGPLGQACLFPNRGGTLVSPRQLLHDPDLPEVFAPERPAAELPEPLLSWLQATFPMDDRQLDRLVDHLVTVHDEAMAARQGARSEELLELLARLLGIEEEGPLPELPRRLKLHRRLRVETAQGEWKRPRSLLVPDPDHIALIEAFHAAPPERASARYRKRSVRRLLAALGAANDLRPEALIDLLGHGDALRPGLGAGLALARYLALRAASEPGLVSALRLGELSFIPDGLGSLHRPGELVWPSVEARAVLGDRPECFPHPELFLTVPQELSERLPFRLLDDAPFAEVLESLDRAALGGEIPEAILSWLDAGLASRRLEPQVLREALGDLAFLADSQGNLRRAADVFRSEVAGLFGGRRAQWPEAQRYRRLADALGIAQQPGRRELLRFLAEVTQDALRLGPAALAEAEPELLRCLPRCLAKLVELGDPLPSPLILSAMDFAPAGQERQSLCLSEDDRLCLPEPTELAQAARTRGISLLHPVLRDQAAALHERLGRAGCPPLWDRFSPDPLPILPPDDATGSHAAARLTGALAALAQRRAELARAHPHVPVARWRDEKIPTEVRVVSSLTLRGALAGVRLEMEVPVALSGALLYATPAGLANLDRVAECLTRERLLVGFADRAVVASVAELLEAGWAEASPAERTRPPRPEPRAAREAGDVARATAALGELPKPPKPERASAARPRAATARAEPAPAEADPKDEPARRIEAPGPEQGDGMGLLGRFRRWLKGPPRASQETTSPDARSASPRGTAPRAGHIPRGGEDPAAPPPSHGRFFAPRDAVTSQLGGGAGWLRDRDRPPAFGFAFAPARLPLPYLYAAQLVADRFEARSQRWLPSGLSASFEAPGEEREGLVALEGRVPAGEVQLPLPLYGRLESIEGPVRLLGAGGGRILVTAPAPAEISLRVSLGGAPRFEDPGPEAVAAWARAELPPHLLEATVPDAELPEPTLAFVAALATSGAEPLRRALEVRSFVQRRYRYDPSYLEDPELARWLAGLARGRANAHLALLHAGRDARHLGAGVCYELGVLCCELLRRVDVPASVATGWTLDRGRLDEPDHLWAMALLPSHLGPRWLPLDASTTRDGRPLHATDRPVGPWRASKPRGAGKVPRDPTWSEATSAPAKDASLPLPDLLRVAHHVEQLTGIAGLDEVALRQRCRALLDDPEKARTLLELLMSD